MLDNCKLMLNLCVSIDKEFANCYVYNILATSLAEVYQ